MNGLQTKKLGRLANEGFLIVYANPSLQGDAFRVLAGVAALRFGFLMGAGASSSLIWLKFVYNLGGELLFTLFCGSRQRTEERQKTQLDSNQFALRFEV